MKRILAPLVLLACGFVLLKLSQPYINSYHFEKLIQQEVNEPLHAQTMHRAILDQARGMGFIVRDDDVQVERIRKGYELRVHYVAPLDLRVYQTSIDFNSVARTTQESAGE